ncbi:MAG TPA: hypothetical protein VJR25_00520, partial [Microbacterium sp.]|nr:hypothetical protein [Microbacterium sp.]
VLWPLSVVVTAVLTYGALAVLSGRGGLTEAETLALTRDGASQGLFGTASDVVGASFHGLTVVRAMDVFGGPGVACLAVFPTTTDPAEMQGPIYTGCTAGALPAIVQVGVDDVSPAGLRQQYADGTGLRFVLDGDSVRVLVDGSGRVTPGA